MAKKSYQLEVADKEKLNKIKIELTQLGAKNIYQNKDKFYNYTLVFNICNFKVFRSIESKFPNIKEM